MISCYCWLWPPYHLMLVAYTREKCLCKCVWTMVKHWKYLSFHAQNQTRLWNELLVSDLHRSLTSRPTHIGGGVLLKTEEGMLVVRPNRGSPHHEHAGWHQ